MKLFDQTIELLKKHPCLSLTALLVSLFAAYWCCIVSLALLLISTDRYLAKDVKKGTTLKKGSLSESVGSVIH